MRAIIQPELRFVTFFAERFEVLAGLLRPQASIGADKLMVRVEDSGSHTYRLVVDVPLDLNSRAPGWNIQVELTDVFGRPVILQNCELVIYKDTDFDGYNDLMEIVHEQKFSIPLTGEFWDIPAIQYAAGRLAEMVYLFLAGEIELDVFNGLSDKLTLKV